MGYKNSCFFLFVCLKHKLQTDDMDFASLRNNIERLETSEGRKHLSLRREYNSLVGGKKHGRPQRAESPNPGSKKKKRCSKGSRRNKKTGRCNKTSGKAKAKRSRSKAKAARVPKTQKEILEALEALEKVWIEAKPHIMGDIFDERFFEDAFNLDEDDVKYSETGDYYYFEIYKNELNKLKQRLGDKYKFEKESNDRYVLREKRGAATVSKTQKSEPDPTFNYQTGDLYATYDDIVAVLGEPTVVEREREGDYGNPMDTAREFLEDTEASEMETEVSDNLLKTLNMLPDHITAKIYFEKFDKIVEKYRSKMNEGFESFHALKESQKGNLLGFQTQFKSYGKLPESLPGVEDTLEDLTEFASGITIEDVLTDFPRKHEEAMVTGDEIKSILDRMKNIHKAFVKEIQSIDPSNYDVSKIIQQLREHKEILPKYKEAFLRAFNSSDLMSRLEQKENYDELMSIIENGKDEALSDELDQSMYPYIQWYPKVNAMWHIPSRGGTTKIYASRRPIRVAKHQGLTDWNVAGDLKHVKKLFPNHQIYHMGREI